MFKLELHTTCGLNLFPLDTYDSRDAAIAAAMRLARTNQITLMLIHKVA